MKLILYIFLVIGCVMGTSTATTVISDTVTGQMGSVSYHMSYDGGHITTAPTTVVKNAESLYVAVTGLSADGGTMDTQLWAKDNQGDNAIVSAKTGAATTVSNYNMYGYVVPGLAWAGQYANSITSTGEIKLEATGYNADAKSVGVGYIPGGNVENWYQDSMAGSSPFSPYTWSQTNVYPGSQISSWNEPSITMLSMHVNNGMLTLAANQMSSGSVGNVGILSMGYSNPGISFANVDTSGTYSYALFDLIQGINTHGIVYY